MSDYILPERARKFNFHIAKIFEDHKRDKAILIKLLNKKGMTYEQIGEALGISKQLVNIWAQYES